jgi:hypothetical protein
VGRTPALQARGAAVRSGAGSAPLLFQANLDMPARRCSMPPSCLPFPLLASFPLIDQPLFSHTLLPPPAPFPFRPFRRSRAPAHPECARASPAGSTPLFPLKLPPPYTITPHTPTVLRQRGTAPQTPRAKLAPHPPANSHPQAKLVGVHEGCNLFGFLEVNKVAGNFHIAPGKAFESSAGQVRTRIRACSCSPMPSFMREAGALPGCILRGCTVGAPAASFFHPPASSSLPLLSPRSQNTPFPPIPAHAPRQSVIIFTTPSPPSADPRVQAL